MLERILHIKWIKSIGYFFICLLLSCGAEPEQEDTDAVSSEDDSDNQPIVISSFREFEPNSEGDNTDYHFDFRQGMPDEFHFDTIVIKKTDKKAEYMAYYLQSTDPAMKDFNQKMLNSIVLNIESDAEYVDGPTEESLLEEYYSYELGPFEFFMNNDIISMCYVIDTYTEGGNHHNYSWYTFNYDRNTNNVLRLEDVFVLKTTEDSAALLNDIRQNLDDVPGCQDLFEPFDYMDFSFVRDGIVMNPYLSWACGMQRALLKSEDDFASINDEWQ